jgi:hypothetical protein
MIAFIIAIFILPLVNLSDVQVTFTGRKQIDVNAPIRSITGLAPSKDGTLYVTDTYSKKIYHVDATLKKIINQAGGSGKGPGEFSGSIINITLIDDVLYVLTTDSFVHRFDKNLKYIGRVLTKSTVISIVKVGNNSILGYTSNGMVINEPTTMAYFALEVYKSDFSAKVEGLRYPPVRSFPHVVYGTGSLAKFGSALLIAYLGLNVVDMYGTDGKRLKSIVLQKWDKKPNTVKLPVQVEVVNRMKSLGFTKPDEMPDGNIVAHLAGDTEYAVVLGGKYTPEPQKSITIINSKHEVTYAKLERSTEQLFLRGNILYALEKDEDDVYSIATYRLV